MADQGITIIALIIAAGLSMFFIMLLINSVLLHFAAICVSISQRSFGKAFLSTLQSFFLVLFVGIALSFIPFIGQTLTFAAGLLLPALITMNVYQTTFTKAFLAELIRMGIGFFFLVLITFMIVLIVGFGTFQSLLMNPTW